MIPRTYPSSYDNSNTSKIIIYKLSSVVGLKEWVDYIPVKVVSSPTSINKYDQTGGMLTETLSSVSGLVGFKDYLPVYVDSSKTLAWSTNSNGYIPIVEESGGTWTPADLPDLALWLDADDASTITLNGSNVSQWDDKSGNGRNVSQAVAASQPAYQATGFVGKPGIYFNGSTTYLFNTSAFMYDAGAVSAFSAMRPAPSAINQFFLAEGSSTTTTPIYGTLVNRSTTDLNDQSVYYRPDAGGGLAGVILFDDGMAAADRIVGLIDSGTQFIAYNNGTTGSSVNYTRGVTTLNQFSIGGLLRTTFGLAMPSTAGEIVVATGVLSTDNRQKLEGYLAWKWGLEANLPVGHPYKNTPPTV